MCGIAGTAGLPVGAAALERSAAAMAARGPDGEGTWADATCELAFRRLAIIDLDERSDQPLHFGGLHLIFNGEIYNYIELREELRGLGHRFVTEGDGEVLLHAWAQWGERALHRINGMFALAIWDAAAERLHLAVDPFGEKPLLLCERDGGLAFASDVRALRELADGIGAPDERAVAEYLAAGTMPLAPRTFFSGVERLAPAHAASWDAAGGLRRRRYWTPAQLSVAPRYSDAVAQLRSLLADAIRLRLRSDVPVGTSLSGGVDSSAIVALASELAPEARRHAFTARFAGYERDEWGYAGTVAAAAGVGTHHAVEPSLERLLGGDLERLVADQGEPVQSTSVYAQWCVNRAAHEAGVVVLLDGQGADELFAGYPGMEAFAVADGGLRATARALRARHVDPLAVAMAISAGRGPAPIAARLRRRIASPYATAAVVAAGTRRGPALNSAVPTGGGALGRELRRQAFATSLPVLLRYADLSSMAHSREVRLPFLDRRIAEFALSCPPGYLFRGGRTKAILRDAVAGLVPDAVLTRRDKVGFETPEQRWFADERMRAYAATVLLDPAASTRGMLAVEAIETDVHNGSWRDPRAAWRALNLELWRRAWT